MAMKLPIVAYGSAAIPETARDVGFVWPERDPFLIAESVDYLVHNEEASVALGLKGHESYQQRFSNDVIERQFLEATSAAGISL
jgi:glycosyltransferase involved in cell wall biosynthesis